MDFSKEAVDENLTQLLPKIRSLADSEAASRSRISEPLKVQKEEMDTFTIENGMLSYCCSK